MSMQRWKKMAEEKAAVDAQTRQIRQTIRKSQIAKKCSQLSSEELFEPITRRLDQQAAQLTTETADGAETERPDAPTPPPSPPPPPPTPTEEDDVHGFVFPPHPEFAEGIEGAEKPQRAKWKKAKVTKFLEKTNESNRLRTITSPITKMKRNLSYKMVKTGEMKGYTLADLKKARDKIFELHEGGETVAAAATRGKGAAFAYEKTKSPTLTRTNSLDERN